jgi:hypothetical protein
MFDYLGDFKNQSILFMVVVIVAATGYYITRIHQKTKLDAVVKKVEKAQKKKEKLKKLQKKIAAEKKKLRKSKRNWLNRYARIPDTVTNVGGATRITRLTQEGFDDISISVEGTNERDGYSETIYAVSGEGEYSALYNTVWNLENSRSLYHVRGLQTSYTERREQPEEDEEDAQPQMDLLVSFQMKVAAIFGVVKTPGDTPETREPRSLPEIADETFPRSTPSVNPLYPLVFEKVPPNEEGKLNVETAVLLSITGEEATFLTTDGETKVVREGDEVYLGRITAISSKEGTVTARLNRGGIIETVTRKPKGFVPQAASL